MKSRITFILVGLLISCSEGIGQNQIIGKWWGIDQEEHMGVNELDYIEVHFKEDEAFFLTYSIFGRWHVKYKYDQDSLSYYEYGYSIGYKQINDSIMILSDSEKTITFFKMDSSIVTYDEINMSDSILENKFIWEFRDRAYKAMGKKQEE